MVRIKEIKISIHRKYTKDFQSYGYRIGVMLDVDKGDNSREGYYEAKAFLNERIAEEDLIIKNIMDKKVAEKESRVRELISVPEVKTYEVSGKRELVKIPMSGDGGGEIVMIPFDVKQIKRTSPKAVLVELFGTKGDLWIPKSCVGDGDAMDLMQKGVKSQLFVASWFLIKSGLVS